MTGGQTYFLTHESLSLGDSMTRTDAFVVRSELCQHVTAGHSGVLPEGTTLQITERRRSMTCDVRRSAKEPHELLNGQAGVFQNSREGRSFDRLVCGDHDLPPTAREDHVASPLPGQCPSRPLERPRDLRVGQ